MLEEVGKRPGGDPGAAFSVRPFSFQARRAEGMTITFSADERVPVDVLASTQRSLLEAGEELTRLIEQIRHGKFDEAKAAPGAVKDLKRALIAVIIGKRDAEQLCKQASGSAGAGALDFDAARDEIGRRLARLRDAR